MFSSRKLLYCMKHALGCAMLTFSLYGESSIHKYKLEEPQGKVQNVFNQFCWLNLDVTKDMNLLKEICKAAEMKKSLCLMIEPDVFSFSEIELAWIRKHFSVLTISKRDIKALVSFKGREKRDISMNPSICLIRIEVSKKGSSIRISSAEYFSRIEIHELYSKGLLVEEMNLFLRGAPLQDISSPVPSNDLLEKNTTMKQDPVSSDQNTVSFRRIRLFPGSLSPI